MPSSGEGWSAVFPGKLEQFVDEVPLSELDITLSNDINLREAGEEALAVMVAQMPVDETSPALIDEIRAQFFSTAAGTGTIVGNSPLLDSNGRFRGRDAVVFTERAFADEAGELGELNALVFTRQRRCTRCSPSRARTTAAPPCERSSRDSRSVGEQRRRGLGLLASGDTVTLPNTEQTACTASHPTASGPRTDPARSRLGLRSGHHRRRRDDHAPHDSATVGRTVRRASPRRW